MTKSSVYRAAIFCAIAVCISLVCSYQAQAQADPNLFICNTCTVPPSAPTLLTDTGSINVGLAGNPGTVSPLIIIIGVYDSTTVPLLSDSLNPATTIAPGGSAIYGWNGTAGNSSNGVTFNSSDGTTSAYAALGFTPQGGGSSEQFGNWNTDLSNNSLTPATFFTLYAYELTGIAIPAGPIQIDESGAPIGSFVIGYACGTTTSSCTGSDTLGVTPDTTAGIIDSVSPEPSSMLLFGTGFLVIGGILRRRLLA